MMRYRLRTLLIVLALGPPVLGWLLVQNWEFACGLAIAAVLALGGTWVGMRFDPPSGNS